jgi:hypothetical protein
MKQIYYIEVPSFREFLVRKRHNSLNKKTRRETSVVPYSKNPLWSPFLSLALTGIYFVFSVY